MKTINVLDYPGKRISSITVNENHYARTFMLAGGEKEIYNCAEALTPGAYDSGIEMGLTHDEAIARMWQVWDQNEDCAKVEDVDVDSLPRMTVKVEIH